MRNVLVIIFLFIAHYAMGAQYAENLIMKDGKIGFKNSDTASATPQSGFSSMYVNGEKRLYFKADDGVAHDVLLNSMAELNDLLDVESATSTAGQVLTFDGSVWSGQTSTASLSALHDVDVATATTNEFLKYNGTKWINASIPQINSLDDIGDVDVATATAGQILKYNGSQWTADAEAGGKILHAVSPIQLTQDVNNATVSIGLDTDSSLTSNSDSIVSSQKAIKSYIDTGLALKADDISAQMKDFTGFVDPSAVTVSYNSTTRQVSIGGTTTAYWRGKPVTLDSTSPPHTNSYGTWYLSYDGGTGTVTWSNSAWTFDKLQIAIIQYQPNYVFGTRESHGMNLGWNSHKELHETIGTYLSSGGDLSGYVLSSTTAANRRPDVSAATVNDEDIPTVNPSLTSKLYTRFNLNGSTPTASITTGSSDIVNVSGNQPYYNQFTGGSWKQTLMSNNNYQAIWLVAVPVTSDSGSQDFRYIWVQGQSQSPTLSTIQALTPNDINLDGLVGTAPEYVFIAKVIIQYTAANWTLTSVQKLTGNRFNQTGSPSGTYLSSVSTDSTLTGSGGVLDPLKVAIPLTATQSALLSNTSMTSGYVPKYNGSGLVNSVMYDSGTQIGIGTSAPEVALHVSGDTVATGYQYFGSSTADGSFRMYVSGGALITEKRISGIWTEIYRVE